MAGGSHPLNPPVKGGPDSGPDSGPGPAYPSVEISPADVVQCDPDWLVVGRDGGWRLMGEECEQFEYQCDPKGCWSMGEFIHVYYMSVERVSQR
jgi:hypothetical protein